MSVRSALSVIALFVFMVTTSLAYAQERLNYMGAWWLSASPREQEGFVAGFYSCYTFDYKGPDRFSEKSFVAYANLISEYYRRNPAKMGVRVSTVIQKFRDRTDAPVTQRGGAPQNYFDGLYWKQTSVIGGVTAQTGFVEGYISCHNRYVGATRGKLLEPASEYVRRISRWYGLDMETGDMDERRESTSIGDVLLMLSNH